MILDYTDFVEMACQEEDGVYGSYPSTADVLRAAPKYIDGSEGPVDPFAVTPEEDLIAQDRWMAFSCCRREAFGEWYYLDECPHCQTKVLHSTEPSHLEGDVLQAVQVGLCRNCGWWEMDEEVRVIQEAGSAHYVAPSVHRRALLRQYDVSGSDIPIGSLRDYLTRHPQVLPAISPYALEKLVAEVFGETMDCEAIHVGGPNDGGIDIVLVQGDRRYVVQTKRRSRNAAESVAGIREFLGAMVLAGEMRGIFVTTAPRFSDSASATAELAARRGAVEYIDLVAPKKLIEVCNLAATSADRQWEKVRSEARDLRRHITPGCGAFMQLFMGDPDWKGARGPRRASEKRKGIVYRYFTGANEQRSTVEGAPTPAGTPQ
jgi:hypothetical protein